MIPYCGTPPVPAQVWSRWNFDPALIGALLAALALYWAIDRGLQRSTERSTGRRNGRSAELWPGRFFLAGWGVLTLALISPLCALSVALFSARAAQHLLIIAVAAPLLVLGARPLLGNARLRRAWGPIPATLAFTVVLWFWHAPAVYAATFSDDAVYWSMHATMLATAIWLWHALLDDAQDQTLEILGAGFLATMQMAVLGALLTFSVAPIYGEHFLTSGAFGLSPLDDQRLGGLIMWIPGCATLLAATLAALARLLHEPATPR